MKFKFSYAADFPNQEKISLLEDTCEKFFNDKTKKIGCNKQGDKCIRGFYIHLYENGDVDFAPVILYADKLVHDIDFKRLGISRENSEKYERQFHKVDIPFVSLKKFCYILHDGQNYHEIMLDLSPVALPVYMIRNEIIEQLNTLFFVNPFKERLEKSLNEKSNKVKIKI